MTLRDVLWFLSDAGSAILDADLTGDLYRVPVIFAGACLLVLIRLIWDALTGGTD